MKNEEARKYERARNLLIPLAQKKANKNHGRFPGNDREEWSRDWTRCFLDEMDRLAREVGILTF